MSSREYGHLKSEMTKDATRLDTCIKTYEQQGFKTLKTMKQFEPLDRIFQRLKNNTENFIAAVNRHTEIYNAQKAVDPNHTDQSYTINLGELDSRTATLTDMEMRVASMCIEIHEKLENTNLNNSIASAQIGTRQIQSEASNYAKLIPKPEQLSKNATFTEFCVWEKQVYSYVKFNNIEKCDVDLQETIFLSFLDENLSLMVSSNFKGKFGRKIFDKNSRDSWMQFIEDFFQKEFPVHARRVEFFMSSQRPSEKTSEFLTRKKAEAVNAEYEKIDKDTLLMFITVMGIQEEKIRSKFAKKLSFKGENPLTFSSLEEEISEIERLEIFNKAVRRNHVNEITEPPETVDAMSHYRAQKEGHLRSNYSRGQPNFRGRGQPFRGARNTTNSSRIRSDFSCSAPGCKVRPYFRCQAHCVLTKEKREFLEKKFGHQYPRVAALTAESLDLSSDASFTEDGFRDFSEEDRDLFQTYQTHCAGNVEILQIGELQMNLDVIQRINNAQEDVTGPVVMNDPLQTPMVWVQLCDKSDIGDLSCMTRVQAIPDTGAMVPIIGKALADELGLKIDPTRVGDIRTANGTPLDVLGCVDIKAHYRGVRVLYSAYVTANQRAAHPYLSWRIMKRFWILHPDFPLPMQHCDPKKIGPVLTPLQWSKPRFTRSVASWQNMILDATEDGSEVFTEEIQREVDSRVESLKKEFYNVFDIEKSNNMIKAPPMDLVMRTDIPVTPYVTKTARATPFALRDSANKELNNYLRTGVLRRPRPDEKVTWLAPGMFIPKPSCDGARLIVCGQKLNEFIVRQPHQFQPSLDLLRSIPPGQKYFMTLDCYRGYFQIPLAEKDQLKTAFLLKEHGIFMYRTAPMGCTASSDYFCKITDEIISPCKNILKLIDDILIFAPTLDELFENFKMLLKRCELYNLTLNPRKLKIAPKLKFGGYAISHKGIHITDEKIDVIKNFAIPKTVTDVRSFIGCCLQFKYHAPNLMGHLQPFIALTSSKNDVNDVKVSIEETPKPKKFSKPIVWTDFLQGHFDSIKKILTSASGNVLANYDSSKTLYIYTDASRDKGLGFCALQFYDGHPKLIECGSQTISDCARNTYGVSELEALAVVQALTKLRLYTVGNSNIVVRTDHQALISMKKKTLDQLPTARLCKMFEKLAAFQFEIEFVRGKHNQIADFCSRYPLDGEPVTEYDGHTVNEVAFVCVEAAEGPNPLITLSFLRDCAKSCPEYQSILKMLLDGLKSPDLPLNHVSRLYRNQWDFFVIDNGLIIFDGRILIPKPARSRVLESLHLAHLGQLKTKHLARKLYLWHNMGSHIEQMVDSCEKCQTHRPLLPSEPLIQTVANFPMDCVSIDVGDYAGKRFLVMSDRFSGYLWAKYLKKIVSSEIIRTLSHWYRLFGYPWSLRSDGAKNFVSAEMEAYFDHHDIDHQVSSAYFSQSNGHAEAAIKIVKSFAKKCATEDQLQNMVMEYNCCPLSNGALSPMDTMFSSKRRSQLPTVRNQANRISDEEFQKSIDVKSKYREKAAKSKKTRRVLFKLEVDTPVFVYDKIKEQWSSKGVIIGLGETPRAYKIRLDNGSVIHRNRKMIKVDKTKGKINSFEFGLINKTALPG